jgi:hypothetical protein
VFTNNNITTKRPFLPDSIHASRYYDIVGKVAERDYEADDFILGSEIVFFILGKKKIKFSNFYKKTKQFRMLERVKK